MNDILKDPEVEDEELKRELEALLQEDGEVEYIEGLGVEYPDNSAPPRPEVPPPPLPAMEPVPLPSVPLRREPATVTMRRAPPASVNLEGVFTAV